MKDDLFVTGKIIKKYYLPLDEIEELNEKYEKVKNTLGSLKKLLIGRLDSELEFTKILQSTKIFKTIVDCMNDYIEFSITAHNLKPGDYHLEILRCWINDMKEHEYNPPHTHHDRTGWSTVLFLKVPEFINDVTSEHKFLDGHLGFLSTNGIDQQWMKPNVGDFYIFEASHQHCVMPFKVKNKGDIRRSMSFNFIQNEKNV